MSRSNARSKIASPAKRVPRKVTRTLLVIDQIPLRRAAAAECTQMMKRLERAKAEWNRFEREDRPAFERWMAATFGSMMTSLRDLEARVAEKAELIREVDME